METSTYIPPISSISSMDSSSANCSSWCPMICRTSETTPKTASFSGWVTWSMGKLLFKEMPCTDAYKCVNIYIYMYVCACVCVDILILIYWSRNMVGFNGLNHWSKWENNWMIQEVWPIENGRKQTNKMRIITRIPTNYIGSRKFKQKPGRITTKHRKNLYVFWFFWVSNSEPKSKRIER